MADGADCAAKRRQPAGRKSRPNQRRKTSCRVSLEKVLGISTVSSSGLTSDPNCGLVAYPAGCVVVLLHPKKNKQSHIINTSRNPFSALAFSHDGKYLVTGESGRMPCVRVWEVSGVQVAEVQSHKYGVSCVAFSTNSCYIVSVGYQHDMTVSVWDWRKGAIIASNKVSSRVYALSFSQDSSYFVTAGNRHVKFWYLDASKERRVNSTVPLIGRSGLLGDHKNSVFCGVSCGRGSASSSTYCITSSGLLCLVNCRRQLETYVNLKTSSVSCLSVSEDFIFCGCADGVVRLFNPANLQYITNLHRPHSLGVDLAQSLQHGLLPVSPGAQYPDTLALTFDPASRHLTCVYNDHSVYVWDVKDVKNVRKLYSALYHSSCVWSVEVYPELADVSLACLPLSSFLTCSSDNTIRLWHTDSSPGPRNLYSNDLLRILYVGENTQHLQAEGEASGADGKAGIRVLSISPDGQHLAAADRCGNLRIFGLEFLDELVKIEAHDSEVLCLEYSPQSTGVKLLASASRDRLIHIFNLEKNYDLEGTLNDHSASITAVKFTGVSPEVRMVSCGADKSIYFQTVEQTVKGLSFSRSHHVVEKTTLYDMDLDSSGTHVAIACQDRNIRVYNTETGKIKKCLKGSSSDEGALLKVQMDPSGSFYATSCSDKNITIFDYHTGECVATLFGHSEIVTSMRFSQDCRHLITVSADSCVFMWRLDSQMTSTMRKKRGLNLKVVSETSSQKPNIRRETFTVPSSRLHQIQEVEESDLRTPTRLDFSHSEEDGSVHAACVSDAPLLETNGKLPMWFRKLQGHGTSFVQSESSPHQVRSRWTEQFNPLTICSIFSPSPTKSQEEEEEEDFHPQTLDSMLEEEDGDDEVLQTTGVDRNSYILYPNPNTTTDREFDVEGVGDLQLEVRGQSQLCLDSEGSAGSLEQQHEADTDSLSQCSSVGSLGLEDDEDQNSLKNHFDTLALSLSEEKFDTDLRTLQPVEEKNFLNPRLSISTRFLSRFQDRLRPWASRVPPPVFIPTRILEERNISNTSVNVDSSNGATSLESALKEKSSSSCVVPRQKSVHSRRTSCVISHLPIRRPVRRRHTVVVVQCRDVASRSLVAHTGCEAAVAQQEAPRLGSLGTTTSSRAKLIHDANIFSQEEKENVCSSEPQPPAPLLSASLDLIRTNSEAHRDKTCSDAPSRQLHLPAVSRVTDTSPTAASQDGVSRRRSGDETLALSFVPTVSPSTTATACDLITCPAAVEEERAGGSETRVQADPGSVDVQESVSLQQCECVTVDLRQTVRRAVHLYQQLGRSTQVTEQRQMLSVLQEAFDDVSAELKSVLQEHGPNNGSASTGRRGDDER
ncbi:WD repeat-containing protein 62-like isoform X2 [Betta splendens]|uniref:WD repeat-containing protein 62-like isoform X2 n=1 Tax=Betta splendens TaxID=158456 RepID=A0A6P7P9Z6_BETSP|nr:WD repeat-containing protein 62-like isoform X2 [Betta splendens]